MSLKRLSVNEVLRHSMHDYLNNMHLIQMNLDLGRQEEAKKLIQAYSLKCSQFFDLNNAGLHKTNVWLQTVSWTHNKLTVEIHSYLQKNGLDKFDEPLKDYLERFVESVYAQLEGYREQLLKVEIKANERLEVHVELAGCWSPYIWVKESFKGLFSVEKEMNTESNIKFILVGRDRLE
ncbi:Spo0B domain-containing protein [Psychrobacillus sp.]|uniref:Spo0B domain-containing protein n=1 Tax=Psychrobacillus sp. TaxID=1871623 RepID=UPI0028BE5353|nr:Spo0B domain-containing protein [Psychrobacillus sp.]